MSRYDIVRVNTEEFNGYDIIKTTTYLNGAQHVKTIARYAGFDDARAEIEHCTLGLRGNC